VKKRQRETYYRKKIAKKSLLLEAENKEKEAEIAKTSSHTSYVKDKCNPKGNQYAMLSEEKKEEMRRRSRNAYYAKRKMTMQVQWLYLIREMLPLMHYLFSKLVLKIFHAPKETTVISKVVV